MINISIATSIRYGNYKQYKDTAHLFARIITDHIDEIGKRLDLPSNILFKIRPIRGYLGKAYYLLHNMRRKDYVVELDVRADLDTFLNTLLHELVHIEQFYQGRLADPRIPGYFRWKRENILANTSSSIDYDNLPWEAEANMRAFLLERRIFSKSKHKYTHGR